MTWKMTWNCHKNKYKTRRRVLSAVFFYASIMLPVQKAAAKVLPPDALRLIYLEYCKTYYGNPANRLELACEYFGKDGKLHSFRNQLTVRKKFGDQWCAIYAGKRRVGVVTEPLKYWDLDTIVDSLMGNAWRWRHHRMDMILVCAKALCGDYAYDRPKRDIRTAVDSAGPRAFVTRAVLGWLERNEVPVAAETHLRDAIRGRAAKLGDGLPACHYFP